MFYIRTKEKPDCDMLFIKIHTKVCVLKIETLNPISHGREAQQPVKKFFWVFLLEHAITEVNI